ncbi:MAG: TatD family deoxyribonuclease, partial [Tenericutes bacterium HGW-Tenericutes-6]
MIIDTHAHLNTEEYNEDLDDVLIRAKMNDVNQVIVIGMDEETSTKAIELAEDYDMLFATAGVHPGYVDNQNTDFLEFVLDHEKVVAVGECGIDLHWRQDNFELQRSVFLEQIELAKRFKLPLVIHTRSSFEEAYQCLVPSKGL